MSIPTNIVVKISSVNTILPPVIKVNNISFKVQNLTTQIQES
jgi:hypothetical protein